MDPFTAQSGNAEIMMRVIRPRRVAYPSSILKSKTEISMDTLAMVEIWRMYKECQWMDQYKSWSTRGQYKERDLTIGKFMLVAEHCVTVIN